MKHRPVTAEVEAVAASLEEASVALLDVARLLRALVADRDRLRALALDCGYPERDDP